MRISHTLQSLVADTEGNRRLSLWVGSEGEMEGAWLFFEVENSRWNHVVDIRAKVMWIFAN